jgi:hypothetical protein
MKMGFENVIQFKAEEDGCIYFYNPETGKWQTLCDYDKALPLSVIEQIRALKKKAEILPSV